MTNLKKTLMSLTVLVFLIAGFVIPAAFPCHGKLIYRFLPIEKARALFAKLEAEAKSKVPIAPIDYPPELNKWVKYYDNPIFEPGPPGSWEDVSADCFTIGFYEGKYWMWYVGTPRGLNCQIGLATSLDGINWTRHPENPVLRLGPEGSWDESTLICQDILFDPDERLYKMWFVGGNKQGEFGIGCATSPDGVHWTKYQRNPLMRATEPWEGHVIEGFDVMKTKMGYLMWYGGLNIETDVSSIGLAISADGISWIKYSGNPVLRPDEETRPKSWDSYSVDTADVHFYEGVYHMFYRGWRRKAGTSWIGHATSHDGIHWERDPANPVLITGTIPGAWDSYQVYRARIFFGEKNEDEPGAIVDKMWFTGRDSTLKSQVGLAFQKHIIKRKPVIPRRFPSINQDELQLAIEKKPGRALEFSFFTPWLSVVEMTIYDSQGRKVKSLLREAKLPGIYQVIWEGKDEAGRKLREGIYFCEIRTDNYLITREFFLEK
jgi:predicted GH43/DUF377 family glycosyl hydrolase